MLLTAFHPAIPTFLLLVLTILPLGLLLKRLRQPYIIAYILAGIAFGEHGMGLLTDQESIAITGELGLILLLFFIGMEISLPDFVKQWRSALFGTGLQLVGSVGLTLLLGYFLGWGINRIVLLGFVISLSSSAVVVRLLEERRQMTSGVGQNVLSILLTQDMLIVPMLIVVGLLSGTAVDYGQLALQVMGGLLILGLFIYILIKKTIRLPFSDTLRGDPELQVFAGLLLCFGLAYLTSLFELSAALGAFVAGIVVHSARGTDWLHHSLHPFRIVLVAVFFLSVGLLIDLQFLAANWVVVLLLTGLVYLTNHGINALTLRFLGNDWKASLYGGALLAQIGELSFVLCTAGFRGGMLTEFGYQITILIIAVTIFFSPLYIALTERLTGGTTP